MILTFNNCQNVKHAEIEIKPNVLNVKVGMNGCGKTTIAKVLLTYFPENPDLASLLPYSVTDLSAQSRLPSVLPFNSVSIFNPESFGSVIFVDEGTLVSDSYQVVFRPENYGDLNGKVEFALSQISSVETHEIFSAFQAFFAFLNANIKFTDKTHRYSTASPIQALVLSGNQKASSCREARPFRNIINGSDSNAWASWHKKGALFSKGNAMCPYCGQKLSGVAEKSVAYADTLLTVKALQQFDAAVSVESSADLLLSKSALNKFRKIIHSPRPINLASSFFSGLLEEAQRINFLLVKTDELSLSKYRSDPSFLKQIKDHLLLKKTLRFFRNSAFLKFVGDYNVAIRETAKRQKVLLIDISKLNSSIVQTFNSNQTLINNFLDNSGISYRIRRGNPDKQEDPNALFLYPVGLGTDGPRVSAKNRLSYGEINTLGLALFSLRAKVLGTSLIIYDDPVSSYDEGKELALSYFLFGKQGLLRGRTVLLLTHDVRPILSYLCVNQTPKNSISISCLHNEKGELTEKNISYLDVLCITGLHAQVAKDCTIPVLTRLLHLRQLIEISLPASLFDKGQNAAYNIISSIKSQADCPKTKSGARLSNISLKQGTDLIKRFIKDFDYAHALALVSPVENAINTYRATSDPETKIELFRIIAKQKNYKTNPEHWTFITGFFHPENNLLYSIESRVFNTIPDDFIAYCDDEVDKLAKRVTDPLQSSESPRGDSE